MQGTGTADEMGLDERNVLAVEGLVIVGIDIVRPAGLAGLGDDIILGGLDQVSGGHE